MGKLHIPYEEDDQITVTEWLDARKIYHFAPINENKFSFLDKKIAMQIQSKAKKMGAKAGVTDLVIFLKHVILFLEMKRAINGKVSDSQKEFLGKVSVYEYSVAAVAYGHNEAIKIIEMCQNKTKKQIMQGKK